MHVEGGGTYVASSSLQTDRDHSPNSGVWDL